MPVWNVDLVITQAVQAWVPVGVDTALSVFSLLF